MPDATPSAQMPPIIFEDDHILVINKPAGLIIEDAHTHSLTTLEQALPQLDDVERSGIVHRLDKETSGAMVVAKTPQAQQNLQDQFKERQVHKQYLALVWGKPKDEHAIIDAPIARHPVTGYKFVAMAGGREAQTEFWVEQVYSYQSQAVTLLRVQPHTGRTHQIRVHLSAMRLPILGDKIYGRRKDTAPIRQFLHAHYLEFTHPSTGELVRFEAPLAEDLQKFLVKLKPAVE